MFIKLSTILPIFRYDNFCKFIFSLVPLYGSGSIQQIIEQDPDAEELRLKLENDGIEYSESNLRIILGLGLTLIISFGVFFILLSVFLWGGKNWARITTVVFSFIYAFLMLFGIIFKLSLFNIAGMCISLLIGIYLLVSKDVKKTFKK